MSFDTAADIAGSIAGSIPHIGTILAPLLKIAFAIREQIKNIDEALDVEKDLGEMASDIIDCVKQNAQQRVTFNQKSSLYLQSDLQKLEKVVTCMLEHMQETCQIRGTFKRRFLARSILKFFHLNHIPGRVKRLSRQLKVAQDQFIIKSLFQMRVSDVAVNATVDWILDFKRKHDDTTNMQPTVLMTNSNEGNNNLTAHQQRGDKLAGPREGEHTQSGNYQPLVWVDSHYLDERPKLHDFKLVGGEEDGEKWFIARVSHIGGLQLGKCRPGIGAFFGFGHRSVNVKHGRYEVLIGDAAKSDPRPLLALPGVLVRWVKMSGRFSSDKLGSVRPVEGGYEDDGTLLVVARAWAKEHMHIGLFSEKSLLPGKASAKLDGAYVTAGEKEVKVKEYEVLVYA